MSKSNKLSSTHKHSKTVSRKDGAYSGMNKKRMGSKSQKLSRPDVTLSKGKGRKGHYYTGKNAA
jgi:hypothetical protein